MTIPLFFLMNVWRNSTVLLTASICRHRFTGICNKMNTGIVKSSPHNLAPFSHYPLLFPGYFSSTSPHMWLADGDSLMCYIALPGCPGWLLWCSNYFLYVDIGLFRKLKVAGNRHFTIRTSSLPQCAWPYPCKHPSFNGCSMDVRVLCSLDVLIYVLMSSWT